MGAAGQVKIAQTLAKASAVRDFFHCLGESLWLKHDGAGEVWKWSAEKDFTLFKV